jgi:hypothetical protein
MQDPHNILKYLVELNMVSLNFIPGFGIWESIFLSGLVSLITELLDHDNPAPNPSTQHTQAVGYISTDDNTEAAVMNTIKKKMW